MQEHQIKQLHALHHALGAVLGGDSAAATGSDSNIGSSLKSRGETVERVKQTPEVERELNRLARATAELRDARELLWSRAQAITLPPVPSDANSAMAIESCGSQVGGVIQAQALEVESVAASLRYLAQSLAV